MTLSTCSALGAALEHEFDGTEHGVDAVRRYGHEHARHDCVAAFMPQQGPAQPLQRVGEVGKRGPLRKAPGLRATRGR